MKAHKQYGLGDSYSETEDRMHLQIGRYEVHVWPLDSRRFSIYYHMHHEGWTASYGFGEAYTFEQARAAALEWIGERVGEKARDEFIAVMRSKPLAGGGE